MPHNLEVGQGVTFECSNGGTLKIISSEDGADFQTRTGAGGEFAYYDDLHLNAYNDMVVTIDDEHHVEGTVQHLTGDAVMKFQLSSLEPNGTADIKLTGLKPNAWYRVRFDNVLAACKGGRAHGKTNEHGLLNFYEVVIPNE